MMSLMKKILKITKSVKTKKNRYQQLALKFRQLALSIHVSTPQSDHNPLNHQAQK